MIARHLLLAAALVLGVATVNAQEAFQEGKDYLKVPNPKSVQVAAGQVEVAEFFWYGCSHCYALHKPFEAWVATKPSGVIVRAVPAVASKKWAQMAAAFYANQEVGGDDRGMHDYMFKQIHKDRVNLEDRPILLASIEARAGKEYRIKFEKALDSAKVEEKVKQAKVLTQESGLVGTPTIVVQGKWLVGAEQGGSPERLVGIVDFLVKKEITLVKPAEATASQKAKSKK